MTELVQFGRATASCFTGVSQRAPDYLIPNEFFSDIKTAGSQEHSCTNFNLDKAIYYLKKCAEMTLPYTLPVVFLSAQER